MEDTTVQLLLGNGAVTLFLLALLNLYQKIRENKTTLRSGLEQREQERNRRDAWRATVMQSLAEAHLPWDQDMRTGMFELRYEVNKLRQENGEEPRAWTPIPPAPPLFPPTLMSDGQQS